MTAQIRTLNFMLISLNKVERLIIFSFIICLQITHIGSYSNEKEITFDNILSQYRSMESYCDSANIFVVSGYKEKNFKSRKQGSRMLSFHRDSTLFLDYSLKDEFTDKNCNISCSSSLDTCTLSRYNLNTFLEDYYFESNINQIVSRSVGLNMLEVTQILSVLLDLNRFNFLKQKVNLEIEQTMKRDLENSVLIFEYLLISTVKKSLINKSAPEMDYLSINDGDNEKHYMKQIYTYDLDMKLITKMEFQSNTPRTSRTTTIDIYPYNVKYDSKP